MDEENENPVANGLVALVAVGLVVGLLVAIIALLGTRLIGIGGEGSSPDGGVGAGDSLYLPPLVPTELDSRMLVTLAPVTSATPAESTSASTVTPSSTPTTTPSSSPSTSDPSYDGPISLNADATSVDSGEELMLSGTYPSGEGAVLDIWYKVDDDEWAEFNLDVNVYGGVFQVFVATYKTGTIQWRVENADAGVESNVVTVHHGEDD